MAMWEVFTSSKSCKTKDTVKSPKFMPFFIIFQSHSMHLFSVFSGLILCLRPVAYRNKYMSKENVQVIWCTCHKYKDIIVYYYHHHYYYYITYILAIFIQWDFTELIKCWAKKTKQQTKPCGSMQSVRLILNQKRSSGFMIQICR